MTPQRDEAILHWIATAALIACMAVSIYYRRRARRSGAAIDRRDEGPLFLAVRLLVGVPLWLGPLLYAANPEWMRWSGFELPLPLRWAGAAIGLIMVPVMFWVFRSLGRNVSETVLTKADHALVRQGPYRWVRHPLYAAALTLLFAIGLMAANWLILALDAIAAILIRVAVIPREEEELVKKFGEGYRAYTRGTGALLPRFGSRLLLASCLAIAWGCAPAKVRVAGDSGERTMDPDAVLQRDLPPAEDPPVEIRSRAERDARTGGYVYTYTISNGTPYRITDIRIGLGARDGSHAIVRPPLGLTGDGRMPASQYSAPKGWTLLYDRDPRAMGALVWTAPIGEAVRPGEALAGFRVSVAGKDRKYERSYWIVFLDGEPGTHTGALEPGGAEPSGDPVERLGRLMIAPRYSRGNVTIRYRTHRKARPLVAVLDSQGQVIRKFPQDRRRVRERLVVWDRRDESGRSAPPGEYFVRVRYGFTERYGRVTLLD